MEAILNGMWRPWLLLLFSSALSFAEVQVQGDKMTVEVYSQSLGEVMQELREQCDIRFSVEESVAGQTVSASFQDLPIAAGIKKLLEGTGINYAVVSVGNEPPQVYIGNRERPGAPRRTLDPRPQNRPPRGVVTPATPHPSPNPQPPPIERQTSPPSPGRIPTINVPTGGGYAPQNTVQDPSKEPQPDQIPEQNDDESGAEEEE